MSMEKYISINEIARIKGLNSNRSIRLAIQKGKYIAREVEVRGGKSYEILYSSLEAEVQEKLEDEEIRGTSLVPILNQEPTFISEKAKMTALARVDILHALLNIRGKYSTKKEADSVFLDLYNSGMLLPKVYNFIGSISKTTLYQWLHLYKENSSYKSLLPGYKVRKQGEYNSILNNEMKEVFFKYLMHPNKFSIGKAINLTKHILEKRGYENIPCDLTFRRYAEHYKKHNFAQWVLFREGEKAYHDKVEAYIERDISKLEVGDVLIADGHTLNFQVINPFTGKPTRATLVGFLDWKSTALVGYEIMMSENTQCISYIPFTIGWLHSANKEGMAVAEGKPDILFSTSKFIKNLSSKWYDIPNIVFYPCFNPEKTCVNFGKKITFINPVKEKGSDFVLKLAKEMPHEQFIAVEGWYKNEDFCDYMSSNITYYPLQMDMNNIWNETKLLIVPSIVEEAFGRVIVEASIRGIPVIAHNKGGIAEALNGSGILLDNLDVNIWKEAINKCNNINFYTKLHEQALQGSKKFIRDIGSEFITIIKKRLSL